jgi:hypothetical protein
MKTVLTRLSLLSRLARAGLLLGLVGLGADCGTPENLVVVNISGLEPAITELRVTLTLDGATARNPMPPVDNPDTTSFAVYKDMRRFGVEVPVGTKQLGISVEGLSTARVAVRTGSATVDLSQKRDTSIALVRQ